MTEHVKVNYEEKYKQALENFKKIKDANKDNKVLVDFIEYKYPELKESEDERMWKLIKKYAHSNISDTALEADHITRKELESWLEKQGEHADKKELKKIEQKTIEWGGEDETRLINTIIMLKEGASHYFMRGDITKAVDWLRFLRKRIKGK